MSQLGSIVAMALLAIVVTDAAAQTPEQATASTAKREPASVVVVEYRAFQDAVNKYLALRTRAQSEVPTLKVTTNSREINSAGDVLAAAIQRARPQAKQGDFFDRTASRVIVLRLGEILQGRDIAQLLVTINDEPTPNERPRVHMRYPVKSSMATMPTQLLDTLPPLPQQLEFRFMGRDLVLRDREAAMILDYMVDALPPPATPAKRP